MISIVMADPDLRRCANCERLEHEVQQLKHQVSELQGYVFGRHKKSHDHAKRPGAKPEHQGWFRSKPTHIDRTEDVSLDTCPNCGSKDLSVCAEVEEHTQEDIVLPNPQV